MVCVKEIIHLARLLNTMLCWCQAILPQRTFLRFLKVKADSHRECNTIFVLMASVDTHSVFIVSIELVPIQYLSSVLICLLRMFLTYSSCFSLPYMNLSYSCCSMNVYKIIRGILLKERCEAAICPTLHTRRIQLHSDSFPILTSIQIWAFLLFNCLLWFSSY